MQLIFFKDRVFREIPIIIWGNSPADGNSHRYLCDVIK